MNSISTLLLGSPRRNRCGALEFGICRDCFVGIEMLAGGSQGFSHKRFNTSNVERARRCH